MVVHISRDFFLHTLQYFMEGLKAEAAELNWSFMVYIKVIEEHFNMWELPTLYSDHKIGQGQ